MREQWRVVDLLCIGCIFVCCTSPCHTHQRAPLYIGGFFPLSPNKASVPGHALLTAAQLALEHVNKSDILRDYELKMIVKDSKCDPAYSANMFMDLLSGGLPCVMILGAACSDVTAILAELSAYRNLVQISYASRSLTLSNRHKFPSLFRAMPSESARNLARVSWIKHFKWQRIATIYEKASSAMSNNQVIEELKKTNRTILLSEEITGQHLELKMKTLQSNDARIIVGTFYEKRARHVFCQAYKAGMHGPRHVWLLIGTYSDNWWAVPDPTLSCTRKEMQIAVAFSFIFNNRIYLNDHQQKVQKTISGLSPGQYYKQYIERLKQLNMTKAPNITAYTYDAVWVMAAALNQSHRMLSDNGLRMENFTTSISRMTQTLVSIIQNMSFWGVTGEVAFFQDGDRYDGMVEIVQQHPDGRAVVIGYYDPMVQNVRLMGLGNLWPGGKVPRDKTTKVKEFMVVPSWLYFFMCALSSLGIILALGCLVFNIYFRNKRYIKLSSPNLNNVTIVGCIMVYSAIFLDGLDGKLLDITYTHLCRARFCLLSLGFTLGFGSMFSKTWRVHQIFTNIKKVRKVVRDRDLFGILGGLVLVDVTLLVTWLVLHPPRRHVIIIEEDARISDDREHEIVPCRELCIGPHFAVWLITFYAFHSLLLIFGLFLAFETRKVSIPALNDSRFIGISVYNVVILCAIVVPVSHISSGDPTFGFVLISVLILFITTLTLGVLFIPKVIQMAKDPDGNPLRFTNQHSESQSLPRRPGRCSNAQPSDAGPDIETLRKSQESDQSRILKPL